jgi:hypothetical protein
VADTARLHTNPHLAWARLGHVALDDLKFSAGLRDLRHLHLRHAVVSSAV